MRNRDLTEETRPGGVGPSDKRRVLVADDDRAIREPLARALELEGYDVATAVDGVEALARNSDAGHVRRSPGSITVEDT